MNFFKLYIGDYQRDTAALSVTEHGAYLLMLQHYYATERPLPPGRDLYRILRAETQDERDAIDRVTARFWEETDEGLVNTRASDEIAKASHQRSVNREIGKRGGRPRQTDSVMESETDSETDSVLVREPIDNPNQTPDTRHQTDLVAPNGATRPQTASRPEDRTPHQAIIDLYHELLPHNPKVRAWTAARQALLRQRWKEDPDLEGWRRYFEYVAKSPFLTGRAKPREGQPPFVADLEWLIRESNQTKVIEGKFHRG